jgi:hypothetical protein
VSAQGLPPAPPRKARPAAWQHRHRPTILRGMATGVQVPSAARPQHKTAAAGCLAVHAAANTANEAMHYTQNTRNCFLQGVRCAAGSSAHPQRPQGGGDGRTRVSVCLSRSATHKRTASHMSHLRAAVKWAGLQTSLFAAVSAELPAGAHARAAQGAQGARAEHTDTALMRPISGAKGTSVWQLVGRQTAAPRAGAHAGSNTHVTQAWPRPAINTQRLERNGTHQRRAHA